MSGLTVQEGGKHAKVRKLFEEKDWVIWFFTRKEVCELLQEYEAVKPKSSQPPGSPSTT